MERCCPVDEDLRPISSGLEKLLEGMGMPEAFDAAKLADEWADIAGEPFAGLSWPLSFGGGELVLGVGDGAAASLLRFRLDDLVRRLGERYGKGRVRSVRIRVSTPKNGL
jgi:hypothetical protein